MADLIIEKMLRDPDKFRGPAGKDGQPGRDGAAGADGKDATVDQQALSDAIAKAISQVKSCTCEPAQPPTHDQHLVVVAEKGASYWTQLSAEIRRAQDTYKGIDVAAPPKNFTGPLPQLVLYEDGIPRILATGGYGVSSVLSRVTRGDAF